MKKNNFIPSAICFLILQFFLSTNGKTQDYSRMKDKADTTNFSVEKNNDWQLLNSYVAIDKTKDSVLFEVVILSEKKNISWKKEQYIGKIKRGKFYAKGDRFAFCNLIDDLYKVKVEPDGKCYFSLVKGNPPATFPAVISLKVSYKL